jgi:hypothetical protein
MDGQQGTVRYVTRDPIQNLKVKVTLIRISALAKAKTKLHKPQGKGPDQQQQRQQDASAAGGAAAGARWGCESVDALVAKGTGAAAATCAWRQQRSLRAAPTPLPPESTPPCCA